MLVLTLVMTACSEDDPTSSDSNTNTATALKTAPFIAALTASPNNSKTKTAVGSPTLIPSPSPEPTATHLPAHIVVIDPGHGGIDWGTFHTDADGKIDLKEKDVTLALALKTAEILKAAGFTVILTRTDDTYYNDKDYNGDGKIDQYDDLQARVNIANDNKAELFLSIHENSSDDGDVGGTETWYSTDRPFTDKSKAFADLVQKETIAGLKTINYDSNNRGAADDLGIDKNGDHIFVLGPMTRNHQSATEMPGALTESLFITNDTEATILSSNKGVAAIAGGYAKAVEEYFSNP
jgi:N-acetylmuramoyl-L-alanine amidase